MSDEERKITLGLLHLFKIDGSYADEVLTENQVLIFFEMVFRPHKRLQILTSTQYGKSLVVALACIVISCIQGEVVAVIAPTAEKAKIIMRYYISHLGDNPLFYSKLEKDTKLDRLVMEESKERIILKNKGGIYIISVQAGNSKKGIESAMGAGAKIVVQDESGLIPDDIEATVFRMIAGKGPDAFYCKIGNPFYRNHFLKSWNDPAYHKIFIDYQVGLKEGRYNEAFINEARTKPKFDVLYECKFPPPDSLDQGGYSLMFNENAIKSRERPAIELFGDLRLGCDVAGEGSNFSTIVLRGSNGAKLLYRENNPDTMNFARMIITHSNLHRVPAEKVFIDKAGMGKGVVDRLKEIPGFARVRGISAGEAAEDNRNFSNKKAEMFWRLRNWLPASELEGENWSELVNIRYKVQSDRKVKIKTKEEMLKENIASPDVADALSFTFYDRETAVIEDTPRAAHVPDSRYEGSMPLYQSEDEISDEELARM